MFEYAKRLLKLQYEQCLQVVSGDEFYTLYTREKWRHSMQVAGAGNYLLKRISFLQDKTEEYKNLIKSAVLLHDICRFAEIEHMFHGNQNYDHGVEAYDFLRHTPLFDDIRIRLPIKHHGHLIDDLYADEEYKNLPSALREEVQKICFIIRDADKIANLNLFTHEEEYRSLFFGYKDYRNPKYGTISPFIKQNAFCLNTLPRLGNASAAERLAGLISWFLDINYRYALDFCAKTNSTDIMFALFKEICSDKDFAEKYTTFVQDYMHRHEFLA